ncbi:MAG: substrate-binding domain-containing protein, partial [Christensenellaceae bacterium]
PSDLARLPLICLEGPSSTRTGLERFFQAHGAELTPEFELATSDLIVEFALRNLGIGCVVGDFAREALAEGRLFALSLSSEPPPRALYLVQDERFPLSLAARQLIESIP